MDKKFKIIMPLMPNFLRVERPSGKKQDGFSPDNGFSITDFTEAEAIEFAEDMKNEFIKHYHNRKNYNNEPRTKKCIY